jgi:hypothetical protein
MFSVGLILLRWTCLAIFGMWFMSSAIMSLILTFLLFAGCVEFWKWGMTTLPLLPTLLLLVAFSISTLLAGILLERGDQD